MSLTLEDAEEIKHTQFEAYDSDTEEGEIECVDEVTSDSLNKRRTPSPVIINAGIVKGTETEFDEFYLDRTVSIIDLDEHNAGDEPQDEGTSHKISKWRQSLMGGMLSGNEENVATSSKAKTKSRNKPKCFNCDGEHILAKCREKRNYEKIRRAQEEMRSKSRPDTNARYHDSSQPTHIDRPIGDSPFKPGRVSSKLREALGIGPDDIPEWIYRMRRRGFGDGYPPGYLKKALEYKDDDAPLLFFNIDEDIVEDQRKQETQDHGPPKLNKEKVIRYYGFNDSYRSLRDQEAGRFKIPPFDIFCNYLRDHVDKEYERYKEQEVKNRKRRGDNGVLNESAPSKVARMNGEQGCVEDDLEGEVVLLDSTSSSSLCEDICERPPSPIPPNDDDESLTSSALSTVPSTPTTSRPPIEEGSSKSIEYGTPVLKGTESKQSLPSLDAFSEGIVPFTAPVEDTPHRGFLKRIVSKIRQVTGK